jgi:hypothetical protein
MAEPLADSPAAAERADPSWAVAPPKGIRAVVAPESARYRLKRLLLGPPLVSEDLHGECLGKPTALAVLSSDVMSSCAYASESILRILVPAVGAAAFAGNRKRAIHRQLTLRCGPGRA